MAQQYEAYSPSAFGPEVHMRGTEQECWEFAEKENRYRKMGYTVKVRAIPNYTPEQRASLQESIKTDF